MSPLNDCSVCGEPCYFTTGLCYMHYTRNRRHGSPHTIKRTNNKTIDIALIKSKSLINHEGCWIWQGSLNNKGYGKINSNGKRYYAHRAAYLAAYGEFDSKMKVCHRCDTPSCVNPKHLFLGTQKDNVADMIAKGRGWFQ